MRSRGGYLTAISKVVCIFATTTSDHMPMKQLLHTIYTLVICTLLLPCSALASDRYADAYGELSDQPSFVLVTPMLAQSLVQTLEAGQPAPQVEVRDGAIVPLCAYEQMQVFNVMGQEVPNEHLPAGIYLVRLVVKGETYTLKVVIR